MNDVVGSLAGKIWHYLNDFGETPVVKLKFALNKPYRLILLAIGWLLREDKVILTYTNNEFKVSLKK
jgi:hypothetical protein